MTVAELIEQLKRMPQDLPVMQIIEDPSDWTIDDTCGVEFKLSSDVAKPNGVRVGPHVLIY